MRNPTHVYFLANACYSLMCLYLLVLIKFFKENLYLYSKFYLGQIGYILKNMIVTMQVQNVLIFNQYLDLWFILRTNQLLNTVYGLFAFIPGLLFFFSCLFLFFVSLCNNVVLDFCFGVSYLYVETVHIMYVHRRKHYLQQSNFFLCFKTIRFSKYQKLNMNIGIQTVCCFFFFSIFICFLFSINIFSNKYI